MDRKFYDIIDIVANIIFIKIKELVKEKIKLLKNNPRRLFCWGYKLANLFKQNALNNGERYDPNIMSRFNMNDPDQEARYRLAQTFIAKEDNVLDIACGTGYGALMLAEKCSQVTGVDISKESIKYANKHYKKSPNINFVQADILNFSDLADVVISFETIEHVEAEIKDVVLKLVSLAKKKLMCSVPYMEKPGSNPHHRHFNINESTFDFIDSDYQVNFFYQSENGEVCENKKEGILILIVVIDKEV